MELISTDGFNLYNILMDLISTTKHIYSKLSILAYLKLGTELIL